MMGCGICDIVAGKRKVHIIYEDPMIIAFISDTPAVVGHIVIAPKKHSPIFEGVDDDVTAQVFSVANKVSAAVFSAIGAKGTNMIVHNGIAAGQEFPHFCVNVIARQDNDGIVFDWLPKQLSEAEMAEVELQLKEGLKQRPAAAATPENKDAPAEEQAAADGHKTEEAKKAEPESYLIRQLRRMP